MPVQHLLRLRLLVVLLAVVCGLVALMGTSVSTAAAQSAVGVPVVAASPAVVVGQDGSPAQSGDGAQVFCEDGHVALSPVTHVGALTFTGVGLWADLPMRAALLMAAATGPRGPPQATVGVAAVGAASGPDTRAPPVSSR
ncbi:hypothetical protein WDZ16_01325 [Pseudokineococcus marinus]|uniref:Uncharacterized protein n=1 Tax=Pseudokineococcus marinus TaxID=351215 RepID=A0A849BJU2_9ACTN|nr:hypothetical protein [Pseudokineococcus marinus]NNH21513.1 hypothetical protein [Pseudokineococcus marinus]